MMRATAALAAALLLAGCSAPYRPPAPSGGGPVLSTIQGDVITITRKADR